MEDSWFGKTVEVTIPRYGSLTPLETIQLPPIEIEKDTEKDTEKKGKKHKTNRYRHR